VQYFKDWAKGVEVSEENPAAMLSDDGPGHKTLPTLDAAVECSAFIFPGFSNGTAWNQVLDQLFGYLKQLETQTLEALQEQKNKVTTTDDGREQVVQVAIDSGDAGLALRGVEEGYPETGPLKQCFTPSRIERAWDKVSHSPSTLGP